MSTPAESKLRGVEVTGPSDGHPLVFLHGAMFTRKMWAPQREALAEEFRVVVPDLPAHGKRSDDQFRMESALALVDDVFETVVDGSATVIGLSLGGYVATAYASRYPEKVDSLVISGSSANPVGLLDPLTRLVSGTWRLATKSDLVNRGIQGIAKRWVRNRDLPSSVTDEIVEAGIYPKPFGDAGFELVGTDFRSAFAAYDGPALVCNGQGDLLNRRGEDEHAAAAPNADVEVLEGAGHICNLERPEEYVEVIRRFARATGPGVEAGR